VDASTLTDEVVAGVVFAVAAVLIFVFRRTYTRWMVAYYGRIAHAAPWLYPGPLRKMAEEPFLRWCTIATGIAFAVIAVVFFVHAAVNA
jgi:uncharacterized membrane protein